MSVSPSPFGPSPQFVLASGQPAVGYKLFFYVAGNIGTKQAIFTSATGTTQAANPIELNSLGMPPTDIWFTDGLTYDVLYAPATDTDPPTSPIRAWRGLTGINSDNSLAPANEWTPSGFTPDYLSGTSFSVGGDQRAVFQVGRRVKLENSGGTRYGTISTSTFGSAITTVEILPDSGTLDNGLTSVSYGLISAANPSMARMAYGSGGEIMLPFQPAFLAYKSSETVNVTGNGGVYDIYYDTELFDRGNDFNTTTGVFTAPVAGLYALTATVMLRGMSTAATFATFSLRTSNRNYVVDQGLNVAAGQPQIAMVIHALADMDAGDTAAPRIVVIGMAGNTADVYGTAASDLQTYFSGHLVA